jgi:MFS transporter, ACS family, allantoate permease
MSGIGAKKTKSFLSSQALIDLAGQIIMGFVSFGSLHIYTAGFEPWQWYELVLHLTDSDTLTFSRLMIIMGILTLITALSFL